MKKGAKSDFVSFVEFRTSLKVINFFLFCCHLNLNPRRLFFTSFPSLVHVLLSRRRRNPCLLDLKDDRSVRSALFFFFYYDLHQIKFLLVFIMIPEHFHSSSFSRLFCCYRSSGHREWQSSCTSQHPREYAWILPGWKSLHLLRTIIVSTAISLTINHIPYRVFSLPQ